jgi:hypothetical protein
LIQSQSSSQSSLVKADCTPIRLDARKDSVITRSTADFTDPHLSFASYSRLKINIYEQADQSLFLDTGNYTLDQITKPAVFLRDSLIASLNAMRTNGTASISEAQVEHLQMLFDFLVASAHTASVGSIKKQYNISSETKVLDRSFPTSESKGITVQKGSTYSSSIMEASLPTSLQEMSMTLNTVAGTVKAKILSARSYTDATTLAITFVYFGDARLGLSAFVVDFMSHELVSCFHRYFLSSLNNDIPESDKLSYHVSQIIEQRTNAETPILMTRGKKTTRIPITIYQFLPNTQELVRIYKLSPSLEVIRVDDNEVQKNYIDYIIDDNLIGKLCRWEDDSLSIPISITIPWRPLIYLRVGSWS